MSGERSGRSSRVRNVPIDIEPEEDSDAEMVPSTPTRPQRRQTGEDSFAMTTRAQQRQPQEPAQSSNGGTKGQSKKRQEPEKDAEDDESKTMAPVPRRDSFRRDLDKHNYLSEPIALPAPVSASSSRRSSTEARDESFQSTSSTDESSDHDQIISSIRKVYRDFNKVIQDLLSCPATTSTSKEFIRVDEMLTSCMIKLDNIPCPNSPGRQKRKDALRIIEKACDLLQKKVILNSEISALCQEMSGSSR